MEFSEVRLSPILGSLTPRRQFGSPHYSPWENLTYSLVSGVSVMPWAKIEAQMTRLPTVQTYSTPVSRSEKAD
jgi:hypothetical protein